jgi:hypothetical protein
LLYEKWMERPLRHKIENQDDGSVADVLSAPGLQLEGQSQKCDDKVSIVLPFGGSLALDQNGFLSWCL